MSDDNDDLDSTIEKVTDDVGPMPTSDLEAFQMDERKDDKKLDSRSALQRLNYSQWMTPDGKTYRPASKTDKSLEPGLYDIIIDPSGQLFFQRIELRTEGVLVLPDTNSQKVVSEIQSFWEKEKIFKNFKLTHKRGIILYGPPGSGKSCTIQLVIKDVIARGGIAVNFTYPDFFITGMRVMRAIQPTTPVVVILEDIEAILMKNGESRILNILDGAEAIEHVVYLASTNYPEILGERIINRPSRFDKRFKIDQPIAEARKIYLDFIAKDVKIDVEKWVKDTEGFSFAHLKELFITTQLLGDDYDIALKTLKEMKEDIASAGGKGVVGFGGNKVGRRAPLTGAGFGT